MSAAASKSLCIVLIISCVGCYRGSVRGVVRNSRGEALGGVVVQIADGARQVTTDARGYYRIMPAPGDVALDFWKTGYAPAQLRLDGTSRTERDGGDINMWQLPPSAGVYLLEDHRYRPTSWAIPGRFFMSEGTIAYGTRSEPTLSVHTREPEIVCYHTPRYDARLSRLIRAVSTQSDAKSAAYEIWTAGGSIDVDLVPVDAPQGMLRRLRIDHPLEPGVYAVHWGALEGYTTLENRVFMFEISESPNEDDSLVSSTDLPAKEPPEGEPVVE